ncbi:hypothetical protein GH714_028720 [Hevea brasiliensis]|uniref:RNase H type-1 domain-containing protein n=1 Tax=Hevea brasiliensis TaxID=3981 RepID=A0A6A6MIP9_HEVBR|nr:hypothetical protein GH714_028720 [Hevea brasiliensis]
MLADNSMDERGRLGMYVGTSWASRTEGADHLVLGLGLTAVAVAVDVLGNRQAFVFRLRFGLLSSWRLFGVERSERHEGKCRISRWKASPVGYPKLNCDTSWKEDKLKFAIAVVMRDHLGTVVQGIAKLAFATSPLLGEAKAIEEAMLLARARGFNSILAESESSNLIQAINKMLQPPPWEIQVVLLSIDLLRSSFQNIFLSYVRRNYNEAANRLANLFASNTLPCNWLLNPPVHFRMACNSDATGAL